MRSIISVLALLVMPLAAHAEDIVVAEDLDCLDSELDLTIEVADKATAEVLFDQTTTVNTACAGLDSERANGLRNSLAGQCNAALSDPLFCDALGRDAALAALRVANRAELEALAVDLTADQAINDGIHLAFAGGRELQVGEVVIDGDTFFAEVERRPRHRINRRRTVLTCEGWGSITIDGAVDPATLTLLDTAFVDTQSLRCHAPQGDYEASIRLDALQVVAPAEPGAD